MTAPQRFVRRPLPLEAIRNTDRDAAAEIANWVVSSGGDATHNGLGTVTYWVDSETLVRCKPGDWMVLDRGRFCPWTDDALRDLAEPEHPRVGFWADAVAHEPTSADVVRAAFPVDRVRELRERYNEEADAALADLAMGPREWLTQSLDATAQDAIGSTNG